MGRRLGRKLAGFEWRTAYWGPGRFRTWRFERLPLLGMLMIEGASEEDRVDDVCLNIVMVTIMLAFQDQRGMRT
jgi:hypothetical protein